jgi:nitroimidazol reductase NimA-like FMN-containing flavoprotein (pyridoxamine 5'-phosphate oxidase superfamily)
MARMEPDEVDEFLSAARLAHLATVDGRGRPRVRPVWYLWRDATFWLTTRLEARRVARDLREGSAWASLSVASEERPYRAVVATGTPEVIGKDEALLRDISFRYGEERGLRWLAHAMKEPDRVVMKLAPATLVSWDYGKRD